MTRTPRLVTAVLLLTALAAPQALGQPSPLSYTQPPPPPPPPAGVVFEPPPGPPVAPAIDGLGLYLATSLAYLKPTITGDLVNQMPLGSFAQTLSVPRVDLDWSVSPTIEAGYKLPAGDAFVFTYRFLAAEGNGEVTNLIFQTAQVRTRLDVQVFDFDYAFAPLEPTPRWELLTRIGVRLADVFFDSRVTDATGLRQASNDFFGAGIHGRLDLRRQIALLPGLSVFGAIDGAVLVGRSRQRFRLESDFVDFVEIDSSRQHEQQTVPTVNLQVGVGYAPPAFPGLRFVYGYQYERLFDVGDVGPSSGEVYSHGWFMQARFDF